VEDAGIVYAVPDDTTWLPTQLWKISRFIGANEPWAYQIWNVLALWGLALCVNRLMREWLEQSFRVSPWLRSSVSLMAGLFCALHPVAGMTACAVSHLDWQLATLFGMLSLICANSLFRIPSYGRLALVIGCVSLAALSAPAGLLLCAGSIWVAWQISHNAHRYQMVAWFTARNKFRTLSIFAVVMIVIALGGALNRTWHVQAGKTGLSWTTHWLTQGQVFWLELRGLITPVDLLPSHTIAWSESWHDWVSVSGLALVVAVSTVAFLVLMRRKRDARRPLYAITMLALWPSVLILGWRTPDAFSEVRWYAALPWGAMLAAWVVGWIITRWNAMKYPLGIAIPVFLAFTTIGHLSRFQDAEQVIALILKREPQNMRMRCFAAELQAKDGNNRGVMQFSLPTEAAYREIVEYNNTNPQGRHYDLVNSLRWWVKIERMVQLAVQKNFGVEMAQAYAANATEKFSNEVRHIASVQPEMKPLLAQFPVPTADAAAVEKLNLPTPIPGVGATAQGEVNEAVSKPE
jgi:hypothetical protein